MPTRTSAQSPSMPPASWPRSAESLWMCSGIPSVPAIKRIPMTPYVQARTGGGGSCGSQLLARPREDGMQAASECNHFADQYSGMALARIKSKIATRELSCAGTMRSNSANFAPSQ